MSENDENQNDENQKETGLFKQVLRGHIGGERALVTAVGLSPQMTLLRQFQVARLEHTYADLLDHPRFQDTARFFLTDLYGARDFSQRDADAENVYNNMRKYLPDRLLATMGKAIELNKVTQALDEKMVAALVNQVGMEHSLDAEQYVAAFRICDNHEERLQQLQMVLDVGKGVDTLTRIPMTGMVLRAARRPAQRSGWSELQDFLERGFAAFKKMKGANTFLKIVDSRERQILEQIFTGASNPLQIT